MLHRSSTPLICLLAAACGAGGGYAPQKQATTVADSAPYAGTPVATSHAEVAVGGGGQVVAPVPDERPGLGTVWGESVWAPVTTQPFVRASRDPWAIAALHYNDAEGVGAHASYV